MATTRGPRRRVNIDTETLRAPEDEPQMEFRIIKPSDISENFARHPEFEGSVSSMLAMFNSPFNLDSHLDSQVSITPEYVLGLLGNRSFIDGIIQNLKILYNKKWRRYYDIYNSLQDPQEGSEEFAIRPHIKKNYELAVYSAQARIDEKKLIEDITDAITNPNNGIMSLAGDSREEIRNMLASQIFVLARSAAPFDNSFLNLSITGPAGTGKTKIAQVMGFVYSKIGLLLKKYPDNVIIGSGKDVVSSYEGATATKVNAFLGRGLECVVFIDEAYGIMGCTPKGKLPKSQNSYGTTAITEIVNFLDVYRGLSILIVAGYEKSMKNCFFGANEGLNRRFPENYKLKDYSKEDLTAQFINLANKRNGARMFNQDYTIYALSYIIKSLEFPNQAGDILNMVAIFFKVINSYPDLLWTVDFPVAHDAQQQEQNNRNATINIKMLDETASQYLKSKQ